MQKLREHRHTPPLNTESEVAPERDARRLWIGRVVLLAGLAAGMLALRRMWHQATGGATLPLSTNALAAVGGAALLGGAALMRRRNAREWALLLARAGLVAVGLGMALLTAEVGVRFFLEWSLRDNTIERLRDYEAGKEVPVGGSHPLSRIVRLSSDPQLVYELRSNLDLDFGHRQVHTNRDGMRQNADYEPERTPGSVRILGLGDSGMFGWNVEQGEDYLSVLESILSRRGDGIFYQVLNLSVPGYNTQLEVEAFRHRGAKYHPDVVIVGWCENDFGLPFFVVQKRNFFRTDVSYLRTLLFDPDNVGNLIQDDVRDRRSWNPDAVSDSLVEGSGEAGVREALRALRDMGGEQGFHVLVFGPLKANILKIVRELGIDFYDTYQEIPASEIPADFNVHFMHPRPEGHRVLAERLGQTLEKRGWLTPAKPPVDRSGSG